MNMKQHKELVILRDKVENEIVEVKNIIDMKENVLKNEYPSPLTRELYRLINHFNSLINIQIALSDIIDGDGSL